MEKRSLGKYPNLLISENSRLRSLQSIEDSQESNSVSKRNHPSVKKDNESIDFTRKSLQLPPIVTATSSQYSSETYGRRDTSSNSQDNSRYFVNDKQLESKDSATYSDLSLLLEKYKDDSRLLKLSLSKKIDTDRRRAEEAKLKYNYLDYLLSLDLADNISNSATNITQQTDAAEILDKSIVNYNNPLNSGGSSSKKDRQESSNSFYNELNNNKMPKLDNSSMIDLEHGRRRKTSVPSLNIEYINTGITSYQSDSNGTPIMNHQRNPINQLCFPYQIQNKRNKTPEYIDNHHQVTRNRTSYNNEKTLTRKSSDPIYLNRRSISNLMPSDVSASSSSGARKFSRHLSVPDLQNPNSSTMSNSKNFAPLCVPVSIGSSSSRSVSLSTASELSTQSSVCSNENKNETMENDERERSFDSEAETQLYTNRSNQHDIMDIDQEPLNSPIPNKKERVLLPKIQISHDSNHNIPSQPIKQLSHLAMDSQVGRSSSDYSKSKGKKREMHAITMIVETAEFPYNDYFTWKNNGNTVHKNSGQKSIYYKCSNSIEGCPVNKTVMFKEDGSYLIKYRGKHVEKCNNEKAARISI
ncbi:hypothetical protein K501DRAFT_336609 [Backusella circina FSU 941]|nr:hypothetical protein K501DRAFT_336609 [Backusella circina FSU 941]